MNIDTFIDPQGDHEFPLGDQYKYLSIYVQLDTVMVKGAPYNHRLLLVIPGTATNFLTKRQGIFCKCEELADNNNDEISQLDSQKPG